MNPNAAQLWTAPRWGLALLLACLGMLGPFAVDTYLPAFGSMQRALSADGLLWRRDAADCLTLLGSAAFALENVLLCRHDEPPQLAKALVMRLERHVFSRHIGARSVRNEPASRDVVRCARADGRQHAAVALVPAGEPPSVGWRHTLTPQLHVGPYAQRNRIRRSVGSCTGR